MKGLKILVFGLIAAGVLFYGCQSHTRQAAENHADGLKPPDFKEKRLADAMAGLAYDSGRVEIDPAAAARMPGRGDRRAAEKAYHQGLHQLFEVNDRVASIGAFTRAVLIYPGEARYYCGLGQALLHKGKMKEALAAFRTAVEADPAYFDARYHLARAVQMREGPEKAAAAWEAVLGLDPGAGEAHGRLAILYYYMGNNEKARFHVRRADELAYDVPPQFRRLLAGDAPKAVVTTVDDDVVIGPQIRIETAGGNAQANETTIASLNPSPMEVVAGWNDARQGSYRTGVSVSNDGGQTWTDFLVRPPSGHTTSTEGDPMTCYDNRTGTLWIGGMAWGGNGGIFVARKRPNQDTFEPSVMTIVNGGIDKGWMSAGRSPSNPDTTRVYLTYNFGCQYSTDMGDTWSSVRSLGSGIGFLPRVGPGGEVYVAYWNFGNGVMLRRSFNGGESFESPIRIATRMDVWDTQSGDRFPGRFRVPSLNYLAVDAQTGTLYCVYFDTTDTSGGNANVDLYFTKSENQGTDWTTPRVINSDGPTPGDQFWPWIEVDETGRLHVVFLDTRHTAQEDNVSHGMFDAYYSYSTDGGDTWHEHRLTTAPFDSFYAGGGSQFLGDYMGLAVGGNMIYPCYPSTQNGNPDIFTNVIVFDDAGTRLVAGPGPGPANAPLVRVFPPEQDADHQYEFQPYGTPRLGVNVSCGDVTGEGIDDILTGPGPGPEFGPHVRGFRINGSVLQGLGFMAYGTRKFGVLVSASDIDGDGYDEIVTGAGPGAVFGPHVRAFNYDDAGSVTPVAGVSFMSYLTRKWGTNIAGGDIDGDGYDEIITGAGPGAVFGPHVRGWNVDGAQAEPLGAVSFFAYNTKQYGVVVSGGDVDGDGMDELVTAPGPSALFSAHIRGWNHDGSAATTPISGLSFLAWPAADLGYGAKVFAGADLNGNGRDDLVIGPGPDPGAESEIKVFRFTGGTVNPWFSLRAFQASWKYGANVAAGRFVAAN
jgi:hypothetical protein